MLGRILRTVLDTLFPVQCLSCTKSGAFICDTCVYGLLRKGSAGDTPLSSSLDIETVSSYKDKLVKKLLWKLKYEGAGEIADAIAPLLVGSVQEYAQDMLHKNGSPTLLIPIPIHASKQRARGYNQSELLVRAIMKQVSGEHIHASYTTLIKSKQTKPQMKTQTKAERLDNIRGSFSLREDRARTLSSYNILLIDDIVTTGATLSEAARTLKPARPKHIAALAVAH